MHPVPPEPRWRADVCPTTFSSQHVHKKPSLHQSDGRQNQTAKLRDRTNQNLNFSVRANQNLHFSWRWGIFQTIRWCRRDAAFSAIHKLMHSHSLCYYVNVPNVCLNTPSCSAKPISLSYLPCVCIAVI